MPLHNVSPKRRAKYTARSGRNQRLHNEEGQESLAQGHQEAAAQGHPQVIGQGLLKDRESQGREHMKVPGQGLPQKVGQGLQTGQ